MARLNLSDGETRELARQGPTTIGSAADATLRLRGEGVAALHCVIRPLKDGGFGVKDLGSGAGTFVNGQLARAARLRSGDKLGVGDQILRFTDSAEPGDLEVGDRIGGYEILGVMGHGGMGTVYRATQLSLHREVALKVLKRELSEEPGFVERFTAEARAAGRFNHPNVVQVFDVGVEEGRPFFSMELLEQGTLEDRLREVGALPIDEAIRAVHDAALGLAYAEELGVVHRDLKPENLMPNAQGSVKICDLGLAGDPASQRDGKILGTPHFLSPEQAKGKTLDHRSDIYSLGCTFYRLLTKQNPFPRPTVREILRAQGEAERPSASEKRSEVPDDVDAIVERCMAIDPDERYASAAELCAALEPFVVPVHRGHRGLVVALVVLVLVLGGGLGAVLLTGEGNGTNGTTTNPGTNEAQLRELEARELETRAENARLKVSTDLPPLERASALEAVVADFAGTKAAAEARREATELRRVAGLRAEAEAARLRALAARVSGLKSECGALIDAGKLVEAFDRLGELLPEAQAPAELARARAAVEDRIVTAWGERARGAEAELETALASTEADLAAAERRFTDALVVDAKRLPERALSLLSAARSRGTRVVTRTRERRRTLLAARRQAWRHERHAAVFGDEGALALCRAGKLAEASRLLARLAVPAGLEASTCLAALADLIAGASAEISELTSRWPAEDGVRVGVEGRAETVLALGPTEVRLRPEGGGAERSVAYWSSPALLSALLASAREAGEAVEQSLCLAALAHALPRATAAIDAFPSGQTRLPADFPHGLFALCPESDALPAGLRAEVDALVLLGRLCERFAAGADEAALAYHARLDRTAGKTLVGLALGITGADAKAGGANGR